MSTTSMSRYGPILRYIWKFDGKQKWALKINTVSTEKFLDDPEFF